MSEHGHSEGHGREKYFLEMVKKGTSTYRKMYPNYSADIFQAGCEGMAVALERDYRGGEAMKIIRGRVKNWLKKYADHPRMWTDMEGTVIDEAIASKQLIDLIIDLTDDEQEQKLLALIARGETVKDAAQMCGMSRPLAYLRIQSIRETRKYADVV